MKIVVDASAILAILLNEPDAELCLSQLLIATTVWMSPINWWEVQARMQSLFGDAGVERSAKWMTNAGIVIQPVTHRHAEIALGAFAKFRGRPARLNMGDCFAYALAKASDTPLLCKGNNFPPTGIKRFEG